MISHRIVNEFSFTLDYAQSIFRYFPRTFLSRLFVFLRVTHDGLSERGTTSSLRLREFMIQVLVALLLNSVTPDNIQTHASKAHMQLPTNDEYSSTWFA